MCLENNQESRELETKLREELSMKWRDLAWRSKAIGGVRFWSSNFCHVQGTVGPCKGLS